MGSPLKIWERMGGRGKCVAGGLVLCGTGAAVLMSSWAPTSDTAVRLRGVVHLFNWLFRGSNASDGAWAETLGALHEAALDAEREGLGDDAAADAAKRALFGAQLAGLTGRGNAFSALGRALARKDAAAVLRRRRAFAEYYGARRGDVAKRGKPRKTIVIAGLPRTGSTFLHRLLACDAATRSPLWWEQMHDDPAPAAAGCLETDPRAAEVAKSLDAMFAVSPNALAEFNKFHKLGTLEVEECAPFLRRYYNDMDSSLMAPSALETRARWLDDEKVDRSFVARHLLAWLALQGNDRPWVLKAPLFTSFLPQLDAALDDDDALFVFTSRDPTKLVPSTCGMAEVAACLKADWTTCTLPALGASVARRMADWAARQKAFVDAKKGRGSNVLCLRYEDVVADPMAAVARIYESSGRVLTDETAATMRAHLDRNAQHRHGRPDYSMAKFGLEPATLEATFADYKRDFHV